MPTIDVHAHYIPDDCWELLEYPPIPSTMVDAHMDIGPRLQDMEAMGVDIQALSAWMGFLSSDLETARRHNDSLTAVVQQHPDHFIGLAVAPMLQPELAPAELERAVKELDFRGVEIATNVRGTNLDAKEFGAFYAKVQELDVPVFLHPDNVLGKERLGSYGLDFLIGNPTDTAVAAASLIFGGVLKEFPRLNIYLAHGGGSCPYICGRWDQGWRVRPELQGLIDRSPSEYLRRFYFDTVVHSPLVLEYLVTFVGAERVLMGTDYPFKGGDHESAEKIRALGVLSESQKEQVLGGTAANLFKLN